MEENIVKSTLKQATNDDSMFKETKSEETLTTLKEKQEELSEDWVNVEKHEYGQNSEVVGIKTESYKATDEHAQSVIKAMAFYTPRTITKEELKNVSREDRKQAGKSKAELANMNFEQLTVWSYAHAKVEGANSLYLSLVEAMQDVNQMKNAWEKVKMTDDAFAFKGDYISKVNEMNRLAANYHREHNSMIKFSTKGRVRLELARILKGNGPQDMCNTLKNDMEAQFKLSYLDRFIEDRVDRYYINERTVKSEQEKAGLISSTVKKLYKPGSETRMPVSLFFRQENSITDENQLRKNKAYNESVMHAFSSLTAANDDSELTDITERIMEELLEFEFTPEMLERDYGAAHPEEISKLAYFCDFNINIDEFTDVGMNMMKKIEERSKATYEKFMAKKKMVAPLFEIMKRKLGSVHGISINEAVKYALKLSGWKVEEDDTNLTKERKEDIEKRKAKEVGYIVNYQMDEDDRDAATDEDNLNKFRAAETQYKEVLDKYRT